MNVIIRSTGMPRVKRMKVAYSKRGKDGSNTFVILLQHSTNIIYIRKNS